MKAGGVERRRARRAELEVPIEIRPHITPEQSTPPPVIGNVKNVSLTGVYFHVKTPCALQTGEQVTCSIHIPPEHSRWFPFTRILGKGWIMRSEPVPVGRRAGESPSDQEQILGLAVSFSPDVTALGTFGTS